jgi:hypothetical protein
MLSGSFQDVVHLQFASTKDAMAEDFACRVWKMLVILLNI